MTTANEKQITLESLESALTNSLPEEKPEEVKTAVKKAVRKTTEKKSPIKKEQPKTKTAEKSSPKIPVIALPKKGQVCILNNKEYTFDEIALSEEDEEFVVLKPFKNGNVMGVPVKAFYDKYTSVERVKCAETGAKYYYTPDNKTSSILIEQTNKDGKSLKPIMFSYKKGN